MRQLLSRLGMRRMPRWVCLSVCRGRESRWPWRPRDMFPGQLVLFYLIAANNDDGRGRTATDRATRGETCSAGELVDRDRWRPRCDRPSPARVPGRPAPDGAALRSPSRPSHTPRSLPCCSHPRPRPPRVLSVYPQFRAFTGLAERCCNSSVDKVTLSPASSSPSTAVAAIVTSPIRLGSLGGLRLHRISDNAFILTSL